jgi:hypothetical protein
MTEPAVQLPFDGVAEILGVTSTTVTVLAQRLFTVPKERWEIPRELAVISGAELRPGAFGTISVVRRDGRCHYEIRLAGEKGAASTSPRSDARF